MENIGEKNICQIQKVRYAWFTVIGSPSPQKQTNNPDNKKKKKHQWDLFEVDLSFNQ